MTLRVLITVRTLARRSGSEMYARDLCAGLRRAGHEAVLYSPEGGEVEADFRAAGTPVVTSLDELAWSPDLVHGNHHPETMTALLRFRDAPGLFVCHSRDSPEAWPPRFPRLRRYLAVDDACRERLVGIDGIPEALLRVAFNAVDLERFPPRRALPPRPRRALVFSNYARDGNYVEAIRAACERTDVALDVVGSGVGRARARPEEFLGTYDLVFGKARCAMEAMATGTAVILCDVVGLGGIVRRDEAARLRRMNFGARTLTRAVDVENLTAEIERYDPADAAAVSEWARTFLSLDTAIAEMTGLYREILDEHAAAPPPDRDAEGIAAARYLACAYPRWGGGDGLWRRADEMALAEDQRNRALRAASDSGQAADALRAEAFRLAAERDAAVAESGWMKRTAAWRMRERIAASPRLRALYRLVRGRQKA